MFDRLFGKGELEDKIVKLENRLQELKNRADALESEKISLSRKLSKREVQAKSAVSEKQAADEKLNQTKARLKMLEGEIEKLKTKTYDEPQDRNIHTLKNDHAGDFLFEIASLRSKKDNFLTIYLGPGDSISDLDDLNIEISQDIRKITGKIKSPTGFVIFHDTSSIKFLSAICIPALPINKSAWKIERKFDTAQLQKLIDSKDAVCAVVAHAGESFIGILKSDSVIDYKIVKSSVKGRHKKGGFSQMRFQRLIEEDIRHHAGKVEDVFKEMLERNSNIKMVFAAGESSLANDITGGCNYPVIFKSIGQKAEKHSIDQIRDFLFSSRWYLL